MLRTFSLLLAGALVLEPMTTRGQTAAPRDAAAAWGSQLAPAASLDQWARPAVSPAAAGAPVPPAPAWGQPLNQATPAWAASRQPPAQLDAVYLDQLQPPAPPDVRVAGLTEATIPPATQLVTQPQPQLPPGARDGVFQKAYVTGTWLPALSNESDALGLGELETGVVFGFPMLRRDTPLLVTPQFGVHFLENADAFDLPTELFDAAVEFRHLRKLGDSPWGIDVATTVGYYSDFDQSSSDALRVTGRGIAAYEASPTAKYVIGAAYLNRAGASVLPIVGVIYTPAPDIRWELVFPRPRIAWQTLGSIPSDERWLYVGGEFGGGVWSVTRPSTGDLDLVNYSDWRLLAGYERKAPGGLSWRLEGGYAFQRELEYDSATPDVSLDDSLFLRAGLTY